MFCWDIQSKKNFSKNFSPNFSCPGTAKLEKFQGKKLHDEALQGGISAMNSDKRYSLSVFAWVCGGAVGSRSKHMPTRAHEANASSGARSEVPRCSWKSGHQQHPKGQKTGRVGLFYLRVSLFQLRLVFVAYGQLAWSFLLTVENRFGLFYLRFSQSGIRFGLFCLRFFPVRKLGLVFFAYGSPHHK